MTGPEVDPQFKDVVDCPCGRPECKAFGRVSKATGHVGDCKRPCPVCDGPRRRALPSTSGARVPASVKRQVKARARGQCEAQVSWDCTNRGVHAHHRRRRSQGGEDTVENLAWVCLACHHHIHFVDVAGAVAAGLLIHTEAQP